MNTSMPAPSPISSAAAATPESTLAPAPEIATAASAPDISTPEPNTTPPAPPAPAAALETPAAAPDPATPAPRSPAHAYFIQCYGGGVCLPLDPGIYCENVFSMRNWVVYFDLRCSNVNRSMECAGEIPVDLNCDATDVGHFSCFESQLTRDGITHCFGQGWASSCAELQPASDTDVHCEWTDGTLAVDMACALIYRVSANCASDQTGSFTCSYQEPRDLGFIWTC
jgi:hypothetical protein